LNRANTAAQQATYGDIVALPVPPGLHCKPDLSATPVQLGCNPQRNA